MVSPDLDSLELPDEVIESLERYQKQVQQEWADALRAVLLFGSTVRGDFVVGRSNINLLLIVDRVSLPDLQRSGKAQRKWDKQNIVAPLLWSPEELRLSSQNFPLEYLQIRDHHLVLVGRDPFPISTVNVPRLIWQCQQELLGNLIRIRQWFIEGEGRQEAIRTSLLLSITGVLSCCRGILAALDRNVKGRDAHILELLPEVLDFDSTVLLSVLNMKRGLASPGTHEWVKLFERYHESLEALCTLIQVRWNVEE